jgi:hypothetical protein
VTPLLLAAAHLYLFAWQGQQAKALFLLPGEGNACAIGTLTFGAPDGSWSSGTAPQTASCEFVQLVEPDSLLGSWADAGKIAPGADVEVSWTVEGGSAKGKRQTATLKPEAVAVDGLKASSEGLSGTVAKVKDSARVELKNGSAGPVLVGDAVAARSRPHDKCLGAGPQVLLQPGETLVDTRPGLVSKSMQIWAAVFTGPTQCRWVEVRRR